MEVDQSSVMFSFMQYVLAPWGLIENSESFQVNVLTFWPSFRDAKFQAIV